MTEKCQIVILVKYWVGRMQRKWSQQCYPVVMRYSHTGYCCIDLFTNNLCPLSVNIMKKALLPFAIAAIASPFAAADGPTLYGKANASFQLVDEAGKPDTDTELRSNASRLGVKGSETLTDNGLKAIYKFEWETFIDDGDKDGAAFTQRNIYVGVQGGFGSVIGGKYDTPFKVSQNKVDLFNDMEGDIKEVITSNDNRESNQVQYSTNSDWSPVRASVSYIASEGADNDGVSSLIAYDTKAVYVAAAYETDVDADDLEAIRLVGQFNLGDFQLGALFETQDDAEGESTDGWLASVKWKFADKWALKGQYGESDIIEEGGETYSLGLDRKLTKNTKVYAYYSHNEFADASRDDDYLGLGMEVKF